MVVIIDNYDSFTYNLYQQVSSLGYDTKVVFNDTISIDEIEKLNPERIIISPGPGTPKNAGISNLVIKEFYKEIPILGVCLGHQCIGAVFGAGICSAKKLIFGKTTVINHRSSKLLRDIKNPFKAARYHALTLDRQPEEFRIIAWDENNDIMGIEHEKYKLFGLQFHPESFMTSVGNKIMQNFLDE